MHLHNSVINTFSRNHESLLFDKIYSKGKNIMKIVKSISSAFWTFFCAVGEASYAAHLARNQQWDKVKALYQK